MEDKYQEGTPPMVLLPAKNYVFKVTDEYYVIEIPRRGRYVDLDPDFYTEAHGEFDIYTEPNGLLYMPSVTKVLFATKKYPDLKFNQFFVIMSFRIEAEQVVIVGQVIDMMLPIRDKKEGE